MAHISVHRLRRYRQHLVPLTDMDGSDDSDDEEQISDKEPVFMVSELYMAAACWLEQSYYSRMLHYYYG